ncbi:hypothetical protein Mchl_5424 (plasmid) [Methylorubrum extorquens CM4]|uniref:Uncharacterized protein n=1 Tax=Methylorubrum extorquens (strain CM4 / NCIMB 13688) TaxID=440085 RepID=B7L2X1_METC4|nr:hypothetical protein Mchl_5424 [Methylorubrum extorquens CM4]
MSGAVGAGTRAELQRCLCIAWHDHHAVVGKPEEEQVGPVKVLETTMFEGAGFWLLRLGTPRTCE